MNRLMSFEESHRFIREPMTLKELVPDNGRLVGEKGEYPIIDGLPVLFVQEALAFLNDNKIDIPLTKRESALEQYLQLNTVKMYYGNHNSDVSSEVFKTHVERAKPFTKQLSGSVLDIGCDNPKNSLELFSSDINYLGLDPLFQDTSYFRLIGMAEFLPVVSNAFDNVCFNTSLDHVLDYYEALKEAYRVLKKGGKLFLSTLIWENRSALYHDHVHFHHFKDYEILGALKKLGFDIVAQEIFPYKNDSHRYGLYLIAEKTAA